MTQHEQTLAFQLELGKLIDRFGAEFEMDYPSVIGALEIQKQELLRELFEDEGD